MGDSIQVPRRYVARRNFFNFLGITCRILTLAGGFLYMVKLKAFKLKEDINVFSDEAKTRPVMNIKARQILDFGATYDVTETASGEKVGACRRKALKSILRDEWEILDEQDHVVAIVREDSMLLALLRRFLSNLIPQNYTFYAGEQPIGEIQGTWNPFLVKYWVDLSPDSAGILDSRMSLAMMVLLMTIEGKQG